MSVSLQQGIMLDNVDKMLDNMETIELASEDGANSNRGPSRVMQSRAVTLKSRIETQRRRAMCVQLIPAAGCVLTASVCFLIGGIVYHSSHEESGEGLLVTGAALSCFAAACTVGVCVKHHLGW